MIPRPHPRHPQRDAAARCSVAAVLAVILAAASVTAAQAAEARYDCIGGTTLRAVFSPPSAKSGQVALTFGTGETLTLPQARSADGGRYAGQGTTFWIKGRTATLERKGATETCTAR